MFLSLLDRLREYAPAASILVIGPGDRWSRTRQGWKLVPGIDGIIAAQRAACQAKGCAFWDTRKRTGGAGAMQAWQTAGLAQKDRVHFTTPGYHRLAETLHGDLMRQYRIFVESAQAARPGRAA